MKFLLILALLAPNPPGKTPLEEAIDCYWELDYSCTEARLMEALVMPLSQADLIRARLYESLVSLAFRDEQRARVAVRALLAIDPQFEPKQVPPRLKRIFAEERPPPIGGFYWARYVHALIFDTENDGRYWFDGNGLQLGGGIMFPSQWSLELSVRYATFAPRATRPFQGLDLWSAHMAVHRIWKLGPIYLAQGLGAGLAQGNASTVQPYVEVESFTMTALSAPIDLILPIWKDWHLVFGVVPEMLIRTKDDQPIVSYLLPLAVGVRYGR